MKVDKIEKIDGIYHVTLIPVWYEKLFGIEQKVKKFKDSYRNYTFGGGTIYYDSEGNQTSNGDKIGETIDKWRRSF